MVMKSTRNWSGLERAGELVDILVSEDDFVLPEKLDNREPERFAFQADKPDKLYELWTSDIGTLNLKRRKPFPTWMIVRQWAREYSRFNEIMSGFDERYFASESNVDKLLSCAMRLYSWGGMAHGFICHEQDWDARNYFGLPTRVAGGKITSTGGLWLQDGLPGIYWANFFGLVYVRFFGEQKFHTLPAHHVQQLPDGGFLVLTAPTPLDYARPQVREHEERIIDHLGREAFFEKAHPEKECRVPQFTFEQAPSGQAIEVLAHDPVSEAIPDPARFVQEASRLADDLTRRIMGQLDYSPDSLDHVDNFILKKSYRHPEPWAKEEGRRMIQELTAYYGEVLRRNLGGRWAVLEGSGGRPHPAVVFTRNGKEEVEYPFARVNKLWSERQRADGLTSRYYMLRSGQLGSVERYLGDI